MLCKHLDRARRFVLKNIAARLCQAQFVGITESVLNVRGLIAEVPIQRWLSWGVGVSLMAMVVACSPANQLQERPVALNGRYTDEQPALSGNGQFVAFVSNRDGDRRILMYDLQNRQFVDLPGLNRADAIAENPSLSRTGRYITYIASDQGHPEVELYDRATRRSQVLTGSYRGWVRSPSISPDGRYIVFETSRRGQWDVEVLDRGSNVEIDIPDANPSS